MTTCKAARKSLLAANCAVALAAAAIVALPVAADACTAFVVGKKASATGYVIVGHNNDGFGPMKYALLPATDSAPALYEQGRKVGLGGGKSTAIYWQAVYSDKAKAGKATGDVLLNEHGVIMFSNSGGFLNEWDGKTAELPNDGMEDVVEGGIGLALRFEVVRRARSAAEGVKIATSLIDQYGYGPDARTFTIADRDEAWILCAVRGRRYVARRCPDDAVMAYPNILPVGKILQGDIVSRGIEGKRGTFDFAAAYQGPRTKHDSSQKHRIVEFYRIAAGVDVDEAELPWSVKPAHLVSVDDLKRGFSSHAVGRDVESVHPEEKPRVLWPVCRRATLESVVCRFAESPADTRISLAPGRPCETKYDEFRPFKDPLPPYFATGAAADALLAGRLSGNASPPAPRKCGAPR
ncbi:MAG: C69 family dipeptidase [Kiritimatiellae bacterium]|nr:C69 family dipeptidase [Kiritimatiellia bacterium]